MPTFIVEHIDLPPSELYSAVNSVRVANLVLFAHIILDARPQGGAKPDEKSWEQLAHATEGFMRYVVPPGLARDDRVLGLLLAIKTQIWIMGLGAGLPRPLDIDTLFGTTFAWHEGKESSTMESRWQKLCLARRQKVRVCGRRCCTFTKARKQVEGDTYVNLSELYPYDVFCGVDILAFVGDVTASATSGPIVPLIASSLESNVGSLGDTDIASAVAAAVQANAADVPSHGFPRTHASIAISRCR